MKGLHTKTIGELIVMVIVVIILGAASVSALPYIKNLLAQYFGLYTDSPITEAVECSYLRCVNGCNDVKVQSNAWPKLQGQTCPCNPLFEDPTTHKICDTNAQQYPVEISDKTPSPSLTRNSFSIGLDCVYPDTSTIDASGWTLQSVYKILILGSDTIKTNPGTRESCTKPFPDGLTNFIVSATTAASQKIYVFSNSPAQSGIFQSTQVTQAVGTSPYLTLNSGNNNKGTLSIYGIDQSSQLYLQNINKRFALQVKPNGFCYILHIRDFDNPSSDFIINLPSLTCGGLSSFDYSFIGGFLHITYVEAGHEHYGAYKFDVKYVSSISLSATISMINAQKLLTLTASNPLEGDVITFTSFCPADYSSPCITPVQNFANAAALYKDANYGAPGLSITQSIPDLSQQTPNLNKEISSLAIPPHVTITLCSDINYGGTCKDFTSSVSDLSSVGGPCNGNDIVPGNWNDCAKSVKYTLNPDPVTCSINKYGKCTMTYVLGSQTGKYIAFVSDAKGIQAKVTIDTTSGASGASCTENPPTCPDPERPKCVNDFWVCA